MVLALMAGVWIGSSARWMMEDAKVQLLNGEMQNAGGTVEEHKAHCIRSTGKGGSGPSADWEIGSPVNGRVRSIMGAPCHGVTIQPERGVVYAPAAGKIIRLYPMGNAIQLRMDSGVEIMLRVGVSGDELHSVFYRSCVIQNEIVTKGKMLLEYDMEEMDREGIDTAVSLTIDATDVYPEVMVTQETGVKAGETIFVYGILRG